MISDHTALVFIRESLGYGSNGFRGGSATPTKERSPGLLPLNYVCHKIFIYVPTWFLRKENIKIQIFEGILNVVRTYHLRNSRWVLDECSRQGMMSMKDWHELIISNYMNWILAAQSLIVKQETHHPLLVLSIVHLTTVGIYQYWFTCYLPIENINSKFSNFKQGKCEMHQ